MVMLISIKCFTITDYILQPMHVFIFTNIIFCKFTWLDNFKFLLVNCKYNKLLIIINDTDKFLTTFNYY